DNSATRQYSQTLKTKVPKFEASYRVKSQLFSVNLFGGFQPYTITINADSAGQTKEVIKKDESVNTMAGGLEGTLTLTKIGLNFAAVYSPNGYNYGFSLHGNNGKYGKAYYDVAKKEVSYGTTLLVPVNCTYTVSDKLSTEVGFGMSQCKSAKANAKAVTVMGIYGNASFTLDPNVSLTPEVSFVIGGKDENELAKKDQVKANNLGIGFCLSTNF
ncbi:MAG: hypothetical protein JW795_10040, partial [Chitinivibrionales bacterium]|nr:hypothetical protein [Chitinivibrionales bacterium]